MLPRPGNTLAGPALPARGTVTGKQFWAGGAGCWAFSLVPPVPALQSEGRHALVPQAHSAERGPLRCPDPVSLLLFQLGPRWVEELLFLFGACGHPCSLPTCLSSAVSLSRALPSAPLCTSPPPAVCRAVLPSGKPCLSVWGLHLLLTEAIAVGCRHGLPWRRLSPGSASFVGARPPPGSGAGPVSGV